MNYINFDFNFLDSKLPELIWRSKWNEIAATHGLPFKRGYMQNLDSAGFGPKKLYLRGRVAYLKKDLIEWLNAFVVKKSSGCEDELPGWLD